MNFGGKDLGDRQQGDGCGIAPRPRGSAPDAVAHRAQSLREARRLHVGMLGQVSHATSPADAPPLFNGRDLAAEWVICGAGNWPNGLRTEREWRLWPQAIKSSLPAAIPTR